MDSLGGKKTVATILLVVITPLFGNGARREAYYPFASQDDYSSKLHVLRGLVHRYGKKRVNTIYVAKLVDPDSTSSEPFLYGYWPEDHSIWLVGNLTASFANGRETTDYAWLKYKMRTDLRKDVVPTVSDVGWSSYLVDKPWTRRIISACRTRGRKIIIRR